MSTLPSTAAAATKTVTANRQPTPVVTTPKSMVGADRPEQFKEYPEISETPSIVAERREMELLLDKQRKIDSGFYQERSDEDGTLENVQSMQMETSQMTPPLPASSNSAEAKKTLVPVLQKSVPAVLAVAPATPNAAAVTKPTGTPTTPPKPPTPTPVQVLGQNQIIPIPIRCTTTAAPVVNKPALPPPKAPSGTAPSKSNPTIPNQVPAKPPAGTSSAPNVVMQKPNVPGQCKVVAQPPKKPNVFVDIANAKPGQIIPYKKSGVVKQGTTPRTPEAQKGSKAVTPVTKSPDVNGKPMMSPKKPPQSPVPNANKKK